jgi:plasmid stabilization system protein ParE
MTRYEVVFTPEAEEQLAELYRYIEENATAAVPSVIRIRL